MKFFFGFRNRLFLNNVMSTAKYGTLYSAGQSWSPLLMSSMMSWGSRPEKGTKLLYFRPTRTWYNKNPNLKISDAKRLEQSSGELDNPGKGPRTGASVANYLITKSITKKVSSKPGKRTVNGAPDGLRGAEDLLHDSGELLGHRPGPHDPGGVDDVVHGDVAVVLDVLDLLAVARGLLQGLDDEGSGRGDDGHLGLPVLDGELHSDLETLPVLSGLGDVVTDLLWRQTQRTDLGGKGGGGSDLTTDGPQAHDLSKNEPLKHV